MIRRTEESSSCFIQEPSHPFVAPEKNEATIVLDVPLESPRHLVWLLLRDPSSLDSEEQQTLAFIRQEQVIEVAYELAQQFGAMVRKRQRDKLDAWIAACFASHIPDEERLNKIETTLEQHTTLFAEILARLPKQQPE